MKPRSFAAELLAAMASRARMVLVAALALMLPISGFARMYEEPRSFALKDKSQEQVEVKVMPKIDTERLAEEDRVRDKDTRHPRPYRFAVAAPVAFSLDNSGTWQTLADGRLWRLRIQSPGAKSLNLGITRFELPEGAKLWVYDPTHASVEGPYTLRNRSQRGSLWTPLIQGDEVVVEVFIPAGVGKPIVEITRVNQGYRGFGKTGLFGGSEGACEIDVVCPEGNGWRDQIRAVAVYTISNDLGTAGCTGTLLNDTALDFRPFFLSANHCLENNGDPASVVVFWNFQAAVCGTHGPGPLTDTQTGATLRANNAASDFLLFELNATPDAAFNVWHAGWDASGATPPSTVGIHHPSVDVKAISLSNTAPQGADWTGTGDGGTLDPAGNHWRIDWSTGVTEGGSSGSCIFATDTGRCIGQLHGGPSACGLPQASLHDYYGKLSASWIGGGTAATSLGGWLDPVPTGATSLDGDTHVTTANGIRYDFQGAGEFVSVRDANGLEIQTRMAPIATTFNPGPDPHDGLATCVSLNTAVAARVGNHRVTYQPNLTGVPDPTGLQLRVDGALTTVGPAGRDLGNGGRIASTAAPGGLEIDFPDRSTLFVTPAWWADQGKWYLNVDVHRFPSADGMAGAAPGMPGHAAPGGIGGAIAPGNWLPALPDGTSMGPMPGAMHERYVDLYRKFADAWRVTAKNSLFDYAPGTSTDTFTMRSWPLEDPPCVVPDAKPARPVSRLVAERACRAVTGENTRRNCVFDVMVTGNPGFARTYAASQRIQGGATRTTVIDNKDPTKIGESVAFTAIVARVARTGEGIPAGTVQFMLDGRKTGEPIRLDPKGRATWKTSGLKAGKHVVGATYTPGKNSAFLASTSVGELHVVGADND